MANNDITNWDRLASNIEDAVNESWQMLRSVPNEPIMARPGPGEWAVKEIVGHLVDSASNNHQRFVRLQDEDTTITLGELMTDYLRHLKDHLQQIKNLIGNMA